MKLSPQEAKQNGDVRYNALLPADFTDSYRDSLKIFYTRCQDRLIAFDRAGLAEMIILKVARRDKIQKRKKLVEKY